MKTVPLGGRVAAGRVALVDDQDYDLVMQYRWHVREQALPGRRRVNGPYAIAGVTLMSRAEARAARRSPQATICMHKLITGWEVTDHIDHNGLNNQRYNLRPGHGGLNQRNQHEWANHSSRYKGVSATRSKASPWVARIQVDGKLIHIGVYAVEEDAAMAYDQAARKHFGSYALLNFPGAA